MTTPETNPLAASVYSGNGMGQHYTNPNHLVVRRAVDLVTSTEARTVLDLACGRGITSLTLAAETDVSYLRAIDIYEPAIDELTNAAQALNYPIDAELASACLEFPASEHGKYDVIVAKDLYPFLDPGAGMDMLSNASQTLKPLGWMLLTAVSDRSRLYAESSAIAVTNGGSRWFRHIGQAAREYLQTTRQEFNFTSITDLGGRLEEVGLQPVEASHYGRAGGWIMALAQKPA